MSIKIKTHREDDAFIVSVSGEIVGAEASKMSQKLESAAREPVSKVVLDLSEASFIDSHGMGVFIYIWKVLTSQKKELLFKIPEGFIRDMFIRTNLDKVFTIVDSVEE